MKLKSSMFSLTSNRRILIIFLRHSPQVFHKMFTTTGSNLIMAKTFVIVDDYPSDINKMREWLMEEYPEAQFLTAEVAAGVKEIVEESKPDLVIMDLAIPSSKKTSAELSTGIALLNELLETHHQTNIAVRSADPKALVRLKRKIEDHEAGFVILDKSLPKEEVVKKIGWALDEGRYTPAIRGGPEMRENWERVLHLGLVEALTDEAIAQEMNLAVRTVRMYWSQVQDVLGVYPEKKINRRIQTYNRARESGWID